VLRLVVIPSLRSDNVGMSLLLIIFQIVVLVFSVVLHEVSHGYVAEQLGDPTARRLGRLTLNPLKHLDPFGSVILPLLLALLPGGIVFGWAKPVPYDPRNLRNPERGGAIIAAAGPLTNFILAAVFALVIRVLQLPLPLEILFGYIVYINVSLGIFNLVPIPPLDGSKVLFGFIPAFAPELRMMLERYGLFVLIFFIAMGAPFLGPIIGALVRFLIGG
jgi:Zn-dependent protease